MFAIRLLAISTLSVSVALPVAATAQESGSTDGAEYADGNALILPADYRLWPYVGGGFGLNYDEGGTPPPEGSSPPFSLVFVNPLAHRHFMETGEWPDGTVFVLEFRQSATGESPNTDGYFATRLVGLEAEVKDRRRFPDGWAYFTFGGGGEYVDVAPPMSPGDAAPCVQCHSEHGAVERTFVQFYPTLLDVATEKGTVKPEY